MVSKLFLISSRDDKKCSSVIYGCPLKTWQRQSKQNINETSTFTNHYIIIPAIRHCKPNKLSYTLDKHQLSLPTIMPSAVLLFLVYYTHNLPHTTALLLTTILYDKYHILPIYHPSFINAHLHFWFYKHFPYTRKLLNHTKKNNNLKWISSILNKRGKK